MIEFVVSGGQTGADTGALLAAHAVGVPTAGYMPRGYERDGGGGAQIAERFHLAEGTTGPVRSRRGALYDATKAYVWRDVTNVELVDNLLAVRLSAPATGKGTMQTMHYALEGEYAFFPECYARPDDDADVAVYYGLRRVFAVWDPHQLDAARRAAALERLVEWLNADPAPAGLMVSGPLESTAPGIEDAVASLLTDALRLHR